MLLNQKTVINLKLLIKVTAQFFLMFNSGYLVPFCATFKSPLYACMHAYTLCICLYSPDVVYTARVHSMHACKKKNLSVKLYSYTLSEHVDLTPHMSNAEKYSSNDTKCRELGWICVPLAVKSYGKAKGRLLTRHV